MRLDEYNKSKIRNFANIFFKRLQHTNPFPAMIDNSHMLNDISPDKTDRIYLTFISCLPHPVRDAVLVLLANKNYRGLFDLNHSSRLKIIGPIRPEEGVYKSSIEFNFSDLYPAPSYSDRKALLDPDYPMYNEIFQWVLKAEEIDREYNRCVSFIHTIVDWANTAGQLRTMFPDYVRLLPAYQQRHIEGMKKQSRLPKEAELDYLNMHKQFVAEKVALCLLLPEGGERIWISPTD